MQDTLTHTLDAIRPVIADVLCVTPDWVQPGAVLAEAPHSDSLDIVELQMALEDSLGLLLPDDDLADVRTVADLVAVVDRKLTERANP